MSAASALPPLFARWLSEAFPGRGLPEESRATCAACVMVPAPDRRPPVVAFRPDTKCCTYQPQLLNFQVGAVLSSSSDPSLAWAVDMIGIRLARRVGVTPLGVRAKAFGALLYDRVIEPNGLAFGRMVEARCPYYLVQGGRCGVWRHRNAVCSTWFCHYEHGLRSKLFWRGMLGLLRAIERVVSGWVLVELKLGAEALEALLLHDQRRDGPILDAIQEADEPSYRRMWGSWLGRERELYVEAARLAGSLSWEDLRALGGAELRVLSDIVDHALARLDRQDLPSAVAVGEDVLYQIHPHKPDTMRVTSSALAYDPLELPREMVDLLPRFSGRDPAEVLRELDGAGGLDPAAVMRLLDHGVLRRVDAPVRPSNG